MAWNTSPDTGKLPHRRALTRVRLPMAPALSVLIALCPLLLSEEAAAFEKQWHAGADLGMSAVSYNNSIFGGYAAGAHATYGLTDTWNAMLELDGSTHPVYIGYPNLTVASGAVGIGYTLDVLRWVPYGALLVGGYHFSGANLQEPQWKLGFQVALGLDYAINRSWAIGAQVRYHTFSDEPLSAHYLTTMGRVEYTWGW